MLVFSGDTVDALRKICRTQWVKPEAWLAFGALISGILGFALLAAWQKPVTKIPYALGHWHSSLLLHSISNRGESTESSGGSTGQCRAVCRQQSHDKARSSQKAGNEGWLWCSESEASGRKTTMIWMLFICSKLRYSLSPGQCGTLSWDVVRQTDVP